MRHEVSANGPCESNENARRLREIISAKRRAYNRAYMRVWRSDPRHLARERDARKKAYVERELRGAMRERPLFTNDMGRTVCGFCRKLPPIAEVLRLKIREGLRGEYVEVRVPYCGQC